MFDMFFDVFPILFGFGFVMVLILIVVFVFRGISEWNRNNRSPVLAVDARVVAKRTSVSHHHHGGNHHHHTSTTYYVTFEFESGDRLELRVPDSEFGYLVEGDMGRLTFQGTRYKGFERFDEPL
ncbi:MAG: DUF2500 domain-containing protein [Clostridiaceae bacterium]|jgi:Na+-transporting methylmalonyl-CoA/oxaloacetate decarboxylase gamma subunit|nr:DUF2500 domain-containing protein [Clostridiaceae bacterium]